MRLENILERRFSAFLFDMDGTLLDSTAAVERIWGRWAADHDLDPERLIPTIHGVRAIDVLTRLNLAGIDPAREAKRIEAEELEDLAGIVPIAGAVEFLNQLPARQWAIVTSAPSELAKRRLAAAGIPPSTVVVSGEDVAQGKPSPDCFVLGARRLERSARDCLAFEDSTAGLQAADAAGCSLLMITATHRHTLETSHAWTRDYAGLVTQMRADGSMSLTVA